MSCSSCKASLASSSAASSGLGIVSINFMNFASREIVEMLIPSLYKSMTKDDSLARCGKAAAKPAPKVAASWQDGISITVRSANAKVIKARGRLRQTEFLSRSFSHSGQRSPLTTTDPCLTAKYGVSMSKAAMHASACRPCRTKLMTPRRLVITMPMMITTVGAQKLMSGTPVAKAFRALFCRLSHVFIQAHCTRSISPSLRSMGKTFMSGELCEGT
mmetsp:Transcript_72487/g.169832  ORF Transcript_72487/g.169832 Transcript_72487/m.169832 type:complete len:217 (-) Transcript_72487:225-875(-)